MIEPNMRTMLVFIATDIDIDRRELQGCLERVAERTFNRISVDGDQSTSDMAIAFSSRKKPAVTAQQFEASLMRVCAPLAEDIVRNGEGTGHVMKVRMNGAASDEEAARVAKAIVNSPLVKTAINGNDPNVGRIMAAIGDDLGNHGADLDVGKAVLKLGDEEIFSSGRFRLGNETESRLSAYLVRAQIDPRLKGYPPHERCVEISCDLGRGRGSAEVLGSDLSQEYVRENADYRT
jgi:glutamate N-acetyltransferase / amino-acid N-acetyltransferase